jgi:hypothetical protein
MNWGGGRITSSTSSARSAVTHSYLRHLETGVLQETEYLRTTMSDSRCIRGILIVNPVM